MTERIGKVVIVGGGTAGWMAAAVLARTFGRALKIELIESDAIGTIGVGEATIPQIRLLTGVLGIEEHAFMRATQATFKLGIQFNGWSRPGDSYMHAFGPIGRSLGMIGFHPYWLRHRHEGARGSLWDYSFNYQAAIAGRYDRPDRAANGSLELVHAFHFDATLVAAELRRYSESRGVCRTQGRVVQTKLRADDGFIQSVVLDDGRSIEGELFIDCSGFRGLLIEQALASGYDEWTHWLPCDRAVTAPGSRSDTPRPFTQATARRAGWQWRIPLQHRTGNGHVYCSRYVSDDEARQMLLDHLDGEPEGEPTLLRFVTGRRREFWKRNCVALGLASGFMEPLESTSIHLVQSGLSRLIELFPDRDFVAAGIERYNRLTAFEYERIRDFLILHYHANRRDGEFWAYCRNMDIPDSLVEKIDDFRVAGRIHRVADELFTDVGWLQVLVGQGIEAGRYHPMADLPDGRQLESFLRGQRHTVRSSVARLGTHGEYIQRHCAGQ